MEFKFHMPTRVYFGRGCIGKNVEELAGLGSKALIVTGGQSAKMSGALCDACSALERFNVGYTIFDRVENNPSTDTVKIGAGEAKQAGADFIIGIGGGSPLDAAKAIAVLSANDMEPEQLFTNSFPNKPLPIIAIPTTAGTGSEVTPYSVLTRSDLQTKKSFGNKDTFPVIAFLDPHYTQSQPVNVTINTALDAFSHNMEGYISTRSTPVSDILAAEGIRLFGCCLDSLKIGVFTLEDRENMLYASLLGGMVISQTGTNLIHPTAYNYTYFKDIPHGKANGYLMAEFLRFNYEAAKDKVENILKLTGFESIDAFAEAIAYLTGEAPRIDEAEIAQYVAIAMTQRGIHTNIRPVQSEDLAEFLRKI
mgnify:FL=1|jgi:alcohol dehydrogenase class IV